ncbi:MAG: ATP-binding protein [Roseococcus sp.]
MLEASVEGDTVATLGALNQTLLRTLEAVNSIHALLQARHILLDRGSVAGAAAIGDHITDLAERETFGILQVATVDARSTLSWSTVPGWLPVSLLDREHVRVHFNRPPALFVSAPLVGRASGRWSIQISYPLLDRQGRFDSVAVVSLDPIVLSNNMAEIVTEASEVAALLRLSDGVLLARSRDAREQLERPAMPDHSAVLGAQTAERGALRTRSTVDGREIIIAFRRVRGGDMVLSLAAEWAVASARLITLRNWAWWSYALVMLLVLLGALGSLRALGLSAARKQLTLAEASHAATQAAQMRLENLLQAAPAAIYAGNILLKLSGQEVGLQIEFFSPNLRRVIGWGADIFAEPARWQTQMDAEAWAARTAFYRATLDEGQAVIEYRWLWPDGSWHWLREEARLIETSDGNSFDVVGYLLDVTAQREAERLRVQMADELEHLISSMPGALMRVGKNEAGVTTALYSSPSIEAVTGYAPDEIKPGFMARHLSEPDLLHLLACIDQALLNGKAQLELEFRHRDGDNRLIMCQLTANPSPLRCGEVIMSWSDITKERLLSDRLAHAAKLAQLGEVATGMAHELNQPLAGISMAAENAVRSLARMPDPPPRAREKLELIVSLTQRASRIIDHMRVFGRADPGPFAAVDVPDLLEAARPMFELRLRASLAQLDVSFPPDLPPVRAQASLLEQVLLNLIINACDAHTEAGQPGPGQERRIRITAEAQGASVQIAIQDNAGGIPEAVLPDIFQPFFTTKSPGKGTGLGLSISYGIITELGGQIQARNAEGGACFLIHLPAAKA